MIIVIEKSIIYRKNKKKGKKEDKKLNYLYSMIEMDRFLLNQANQLEEEEQAENIATVSPKISSAQFCPSLTRHERNIKDSLVILQNENIQILEAVTEISIRKLYQQSTSLFHFFSMILSLRCNIPLQILLTKLKVSDNDDINTILRETLQTISLLLDSGDEYGFAFMQVQQELYQLLPYDEAKFQEFCKNAFRLGISRKLTEEKNKFTSEIDISLHSGVENSMIYLIPCPYPAVKRPKHSIIALCEFDASIDENLKILPSSILFK